MIDIAPEIRIKASLKTGVVYYFVEDSFSVDYPHYFIVINKEPTKDSDLLLLCATSQVEKQRYSAMVFNFPPETLVTVTPAEVSCFSVLTIINCNDILERSIPSVVQKLTAEQLGICADVIPEEILKKLREGVLASDMHPERIKKLIR